MLNELHTSTELLKLKILVIVVKVHFILLTYAYILFFRDFIMRSNDLYEYALRQIKTNKNYTTLEMTEKIIQQHRIKLGIAK